MKTKISWLFRSAAIVLVGVGVSGCVVAIGSGGRSSPPPPPAQPPVILGDATQAATIAEIDAAAQLNMDSSRAHSLSQIAERPNLATGVQIHLINVTYRCLSMESSRVQVLQKIIARPDFCDATRHSIVSQLQQLHMESSRRNILDQINERLKQSPPSHAEHN